MEIRMSGSERVADGDLITITSIIDLMVARNREIDGLHERLAEAQNRIGELERAQYSAQAVQAG